MKSFIEKFTATSNGMLCIVDLDGYFKMVTPALKHALGYSDEELFSKPFYEFIHLDDRNQTRHQVSKLSKDLPFVYCENRYICRNGSCIWFGWSIFTDSNGCMMYAVAHDITNVKESEEKLRFSERQFSELFNNSLVGINKTNLKGDILYVNPAIIRMCGFDSQEEMMSGSVLGRYKDPKKRDIMIDVLKAHGKIVDFEIEVLTKQGETKTMLLNASLDGDEISGVVLDITKRKQAEQLLLAEQEKYRFIMSGLSDGIIGIDKRTKEVVFANKALCKMLGYLKNELLSLGIPDLHRAEDLPYVIEEFNAMASGRKASCSSIPFLTKSGNTIYVDISATHPGNNIFYGFFRDVTDRRRLEEELLQTNSQLELRVLKRTEKLKTANEKLRTEIEKCKKAENERLEVQKQLLVQTEELKEANTTLKVLLRQREKDKSDFEENILSNIKHLVMPNISKLKKNKWVNQDVSLLNLLESNLNSIISPFSRKMLSKYIMLTSREIEVADLIREGEQDKNIAQLLNISLETVKSHRQHIRRKLGIYGKKINLRIHILSVSE